MSLLLGIVVAALAGPAVKIEAAPPRDPLAELEALLAEGAESVPVDAVSLLDDAFARLSAALDAWLAQLS